MTEAQIRASKQRNQEYRELIFDAKAEIITLIIALSYIFFLVSTDVEVSTKFNSLIYIIAFIVIVYISLKYFFSVSF